MKIFCDDYLGKPRPRQIDPREASRRLVNGNYVTILGDPAITEHADFFESLIEAFGPEAATISMTGHYTEGAGPRRSITSRGPSRGGRGHTVNVVFVSDTPANRAAVTILHSACTRFPVDLALQGPAPVMLLAGADGTLTADLETAYRTVVCALEDVAAGRAVNADAN